MTKARTLADFVSSGNPLADGTISVAEVVGAAPLASPDFTGGIDVTGASAFHGNGNAPIAWGDTTDVGFLSFDGSGNAIVRSATGARLNFQVNANRDVLSLQNGSTIFNESGNNQDFRVESNANSHMLFVDAGNNFVGIDTSNPVSPLVVSNGGASGIEFHPELSTNFNRITNFNRSTSAYNELGIDALAIELRPSGVRKCSINASDMVVNQDSADYDFRVESNANSHMLFVDAGNNSVGIGTSTSIPTNSSNKFPLAVQANVDADAIAIKGRSSDDIGELSFYENDATSQLGNIQARVGSMRHRMLSNGGAMMFECNDSGGNLRTRQALYGSEAVFNDGSMNYDFRVESDNNANMFVVDAGSDRVQIGSQIFGQAPTVGRGQFVSFNTDITTVSASGSVTKNLFTRSPDSNVAATGTVYISAENSGGSIQVGCIIDFFFSNGTLSTTARETGSSQGTMTFSAQENGDAISVTVAYAGGLGGAIRFNAGGHASIASY